MSVKDVFTNMSWKRRIGVAAALVFVVYALVFGKLPIELGVYSSAYEGARPRFIGAKTGTGGIYTNTQTHGASACGFSTSMNLDVDGATVWQPNILGEMTSVYLPTVGGYPPEWVPMDWWTYMDLIKNPVETWTWEVVNSDGTKTKYEMRKYLTKWFVSFEAAFDSGPAIQTDDEAQNRYYYDYQIWSEFDITPRKYFENQEVAYFAIGKIELSNVKVGGKDQYGKAVAPRDNINFAPESVGSILTIYTEPFGSKSYAESEVKTYAYKGTRINPDYFRDKVYAHIDLKNFGVREEGNILTGLKATGDVITLGFNVHLFVVGEWKVKDIGKIDEDDYGRTAGTEEQWGIGGIFKSIGDAIIGIFSSPGGMLTGSILFLFLILIAWVSVFGPTLGPLLLLLLRLLGKRGDSG